jgi:hypothetical protein
VRPQPKPEPPKEEELPPAPDEISWNDTTGIDLTEDEIDDLKLWGHFEDMSDLEGTRPIMLYVYWPEEDAESDDEEIANQVRRCGLMDEILDAEEVRVQHQGHKRRVEEGIQDQPGSESAVLRRQGQEDVAAYQHQCQAGRSRQEDAADCP